MEWIGSAVCAYATSLKQMDAEVMKYGIGIFSTNIEPTI